MSAGALDALLAAAGGAAVAGLGMAASGGAATELVVGAAQVSALALWAARDALGDGRNRSLGKRACGLELACADGSLAPAGAALCRSWYWLLLPACSLHPFVGLSMETLLFFDLATLLLTQDARKAGDYMWGLRVVNERPGRAGRLQDAAEALEAEQLREEVEAEAPGLLAELHREAAGKEQARAAASLTEDAGLQWFQQKPSVLGVAAAAAAPVARPAAAAGAAHRVEAPSMADMFSSVRGVQPASSGSEQGSTERHSKYPPRHQQQKR
jgi:uncharacterized RDD family membrane protein YckC